LLMTCLTCVLTVASLRVRRSAIRPLERPCGESPLPVETAVS